MSMMGVKVEMQAQKPDLATEERLDAVYTSLLENFAIKSVDMMCDLDAAAVTFHIGLEIDDELMSDELAVGIVDDALKRALGPDDDDSISRQSEALAFC